MIRRCVGAVLNLLTFFDVLYKFRSTKISPAPKIPQEEADIVVYSCYKYSDEDHKFLITLLTLRLNLKIIVIDNYGKINRTVIDSRLSYHHRPNISRDLGAVRDFCVIGSQVKCESNFLFINSSCYWNASTLNDQMDNLGSLNSEIAFGTDSFQPRYHAQSFFIWVGKDIAQEMMLVLSSKKIIDNWAFKRSAVYRGEKKLVQILQNKFQVSILFPSDLYGLPNHLRKVNPTIEFWKNLLHNGAPFLKKRVKISETDHLNFFNTNSAPNVVPGRKALKRN
jgi:hypothetical protein